MFRCADKPAQTWKIVHHVLCTRISCVTKITRTFYPIEQWWIALAFFSRSVVCGIICTCVAVIESFDIVQIVILADINIRRIDILRGGYQNISLYYFWNLHKTMSLFLFCFFHPSVLFCRNLDDTSSVHNLVSGVGSEDILSQCIKLRRLRWLGRLLHLANTRVPCGALISFILTGGKSHVEVNRWRGREEW